MADQQKLTTQKSPAGETVRFLTAAGIGTTLLVLSGITLTATVIGLILATPVLVLFSPILVPAAAAVVLMGTGLLFSGGCGAAAIATLTWIYRYVTGKHPAGAEKVDYARKRIAEKAREYGQYVQQKAQEAS
ncbi:oleosin 16 kDa [Carica papaya]|uniref:oleosin 16 kDa n=1 Tax=Carica papaya TaxID=3649 RepID=UPI000B8CA331|nr:oleosin 16 kDa [Carica papaya]